jgi:hypothetical protein
MLPERNIWPKKGNQPRNTHPRLLEARSNITFPGNTLLRL